MQDKRGKNISKYLNSINKRGVSTLIATVLIVLIVVAAIGIIWGAIMPLITQSSETGKMCSEITLTINTEAGYTCYDSAKQKASIMLSRGTEETELEGAQVNILSEGKTKAYELRKNPYLFLFSDFEECKGSNARDLIGNHSGIISNASWVDDRYGCAINLSKGNVGYGNIQLENFTIELLVRPE